MEDGQSNDLCIICKSTIQIPAILPCKCRFCYECIYRHLLNYYNCPKCFTLDTFIYDIKVSQSKKHQNMALTPLLKESHNAYVKILKKHKIKVDGDLNDLKWRYNELSIILKVESFKEVVKSINSIAWEVHCKEKAHKRKLKRTITPEIIILRNKMLKEIKRKGK